MGSYSRARFDITFPDVSGGTEFFKAPDKYDVEVRKVADGHYKVDIDLKAVEPEPKGEAVAPEPSAENPFVCHEGCALVHAHKFE